MIGQGMTHSVGRPDGATPLRVLVMVIAGGINTPAGMDSEAPRQGCTVFRPGVEEGCKPRRRPRDSSVGKILTTPPGCRTIKLARGVRHPAGVVYLSQGLLSRGHRHFVPRHPV